MRPLQILGLLGLVCAVHSAHAWRFVVAGDSRGDGIGNNGPNAPILSEIATAIAAERPELLLFTGDLVYAGGNDAFGRWKTAMSPVYSAGIPIYPVRGNHDLESGGPGVHAKWDAAFGATLPDNGPAGETNLTYSFKSKNEFVGFIGLDQYMPGQEGRVNQTWLDQQLKGFEELDLVFVFGHTPAFRVSHTDPGAPLDLAHMHLGRYPRERDAFWSSLETNNNWRSRAYLTGHEHFYDHSRIVNPGAGWDPAFDLHQYVLGTAGAQPFNDDSVRFDGDNGTWTPQGIFHETQFGYMTIDLDECGAGTCVTTRWMHRVSEGVYEVAEIDGWRVPYIPEPSTWTMALTGGLAVFGITTWRRRSAQA